MNVLCLLVLWGILMLVQVQALALDRRFGFAGAAAVLMLVVQAAAVLALAFCFAGAGAVLVRVQTLALDRSFVLRVLLVCRCRVPLLFALGSSVRQGAGLGRWCWVL